MQLIVLKREREWPYTRGIDDNRRKGKFINGEVSDVVRQVDSATDFMLELADFRIVENDKTSLVFIDKRDESHLKVERRTSFQLYSLGLAEEAGEVELFEGGKSSLILFVCAATSLCLFLFEVCTAHFPLLHVFRIFFLLFLGLFHLELVHDAHLEMQTSL